MGVTPGPERMEPAHRRLPPDSPDYPAALRRCFPGGRPVPVTAWGCLDALGGRLLGFFCSVRARGDALLKTYDLARASSASAAFRGGESRMTPSPRAGQSTTPAEPRSSRSRNSFSIGDWKPPTSVTSRLRRAAADLILSFFDDALRRPTAALAAERNARVAALADRLLVAHAEPGGKTERLCRDALARGQRVFTLDSPDNAHLAALGALPVSADDSAPLLAEGTGSSA